LIGEQSENTLFRHLLVLQKAPKKIARLSSPRPARRRVVVFAQTFLTFISGGERFNVSINPPKSDGGDVEEFLTEGLPAQGETDFFETNISSLIFGRGKVEKKKRTKPFHAAYLVRGSRGAAAKARRTLAPRPYRGPNSCFSHLKTRQTSSKRVLAGSSRGDGEPFSFKPFYLSQLCTGARNECELNNGAWR
jgi:hypothetical protein